jgi:hypothetical protein
MDQTQEARQQMIETVTEFLEDRPELLRGNRAVAEEFAYLSGVRDTLEDLSEAQSLPLTGITSEKAKAREDLQKAVVICYAQLHVLGVRSGNEALRHQFRAATSDITRLPDLDLRTAARRALEAVEIHARELEPCGYTPALGEALRLHAARFRKLLRAPRKAVTQRAGVTVDLAKTLDDASDRLRDRLDPLMQQYWGIDRPLYDAYRKSRRLSGAPRPKASEPRGSVPARAADPAPSADVPWTANGSGLPG